MEIAVRKSCEDLNAFRAPIPCELAPSLPLLSPPLLIFAVGKRVMCLGNTDVIKGVPPDIGRRDVTHNNTQHFAPKQSSVAGSKAGKDRA